MITMEEFAKKYLDEELGEFDGVYDATCYYDGKIEIYSSGSFTKNLRYFKVLLFPPENLKVIRINMRKAEYLKSDCKLPDNVLKLVIDSLGKDSRSVYPGKVDKSIWANLNYYNNDIRFNEGVIKDLHGEPEVLPIPDYTKLNR